MMVAEQSFFSLVSLLHKPIFTCLCYYKYTKIKYWDFLMLEDGLDIYRDILERVDRLRD